MNNHTLHTALLLTFFALAPVTFFALYRVTAPYGRHQRTGFGPRVPATLGWILMETPAALGLPLWFALGDHRDPAAWAFLGLWELHYLHRAFVYPLQRRGRARPMPLGVAALGALFNLGNTFLNGYWLFTLAPARDASWLADPRFLLGTALFLAGLAINWDADRRLLALRRPGETGYRVPTGGLYRYVTSPNYLGELVEWTGWALLTWSLPGLAFAVWTAANLVPRAASHHAWYRRQFPDYPPERRRIIPFLY